MDFSKLWQLRIMYATRSSTDKDPFCHCKNIGLDFNAASERKEKLDLQLLTNGIVYEVYDFANLLQKSKSQFIIDVLENNFDIGLESKQQQRYFCTRTQQKIKQLMKRPWIDKHELFSLPDPSSTAGHNHSSLAQVSNRKSSDIYNADWSLATAEHDTAESVPRELDRLHAAESEQGAEDISPCMASTEESKEDVFPHSYPFCKEIGLNLGYGSKQTLDMGLLTNGVMLEIEHFARILCGFNRKIILDVLEHNFELDFTSPDARDEAVRTLNNLLAKKAQIKKSNAAKTSLLEMTFFSSHVNPSKRKREETLLSKTENIEGPAPKYHCKEVMEKRQSDIKSKQTKNLALNGTDVPTSPTAQWDQGLGDIHSHMCRLEDSDLESDDAADSENSCYQESMQNESGSSSLNIPRESEMRSLDVQEETFLSPTDCSSARLSLSPDLSQALATCSDGGQSDGQGSTQTTMNVKDLDDSAIMEKKETGAEQLMWKLRTHRVNEILLRSAKDYCRYINCDRHGLDFNVGSGLKQKRNAQSLTNCVLLEVCKFAVALNSSQQEFIMEILEYNFDLRFSSEQHRHAFACKIMHRVRQLTQCQDEVRLSKEAFELPVYKLNKLTTNPAYHYSCGMSVNPEISSVSTMEVNDVAPVPPTNCNTETKALFPEEDVDLYPHCKEIGLKLHVKKHQTHKKLDFHVLTKGAMIEVTNFAKMLCGTFEQIIIDVLDHNYDLDLQNGESDTARYILEQIPTMMEQKNLEGCSTTYKPPHAFYPAPVRPDEDSEPKSDSGCTVPPQSKITDHLDSCAETKQELNEQEKTLWTLRSRRSQEIVSVTHLEDCPFYSFSRCKKIGIDFNVESGLRQNLDRDLLTNGVMVEITTFAVQIIASHQYFITEILEYNFDLGLMSALERCAFAHQTLLKFKNFGPYTKLSHKRNKVFELPDLSIIDLSDYALCPKCDQNRNHPNPHAKMDTVLSDAHDTAKKLAGNLPSTLPTTFGEGMDSFRHCKKIGLSLFVDEDQPREKLGLHLLTYEVMKEVVSFARQICGSRTEIVNSILEHNFNIGMYSRQFNPSCQFIANLKHSHSWVAWCNNVFSFHPSRRKINDPDKWKSASLTPKCQEFKKMAMKRKLALQQKKESSSLTNEENCLKGTNENLVRVGIFTPLCNKIGLDLDVESKSAAKAKLDLKLLTRAVVFEIHKYVATRVGDYIPSVLYDILSYNFDLSSQTHRCWEFSLAITQKITTMVKSYQRNLDKAEEVFELPFVFSSSDSEDSIRDGSEKNGTDVPTIQTAQQDQGLGDVHSYMCPIEDSDLESDDAADSENSCYQESMQNESGSSSLNIPRESEMRSLDVQEETFLSPTDCSSARLSLSPDLSQALATCSDGGQSDSQGSTQTTMNVKDLDDSDTMEQKETGAEQLMWKLRTHRVNEILLRSAKDYCIFTACKRLGLDFNVGSGVKQKLNTHSLTNSLLLEVCKFAVALNSSQQEFIMEILEYNFDLRFISEQHRHAFACETMHRVRQLTQCQDEVRLSKEAFELPVCKLNKLTTNPAYHYSCGMSVNPEISSVSTLEVNDVAPVPSTNCNAETKALVPEEDVDLYPHCKEIGLKLHVKKHQTHKKLDFTVLTKGAMIEVTNFAKMMCGTFEQIIIDVLDHNYDLDLQNGESDSARYILEQIPTMMEQKNLASCCKTYKQPYTFYPAPIRPDEDNEPKSDSGSTVPPQSKITDHLDSCAETKQELNEQEKTLWTLRSRRSQEIVSVPHLEDCPLYFFSRCKKIGIDFNVGSGLKQNLDRDLLTNGVMVEIAKFAGEILASHQYFITEILEYNFDLGLMSALERRAFAHQTLLKFKTTGLHVKASRTKNKVFELPDLSIIDLSDYVFCPKCDQNRNHPNPHAKMDTVLSDAHNTAKKPAGNLPSTLPTTFGEGMDSFRHCKKISLSLFVDEDQQREKLGLHLLTYEVMKEVVSFARQICGSRTEIVNSILEHNFNIGMYSRELNPSYHFFATLKHSHSWVAWCNKVYSFQPSKRKINDPEKWKSASLSPKCQEFKKMATKRKVALQQKKESSSLTNEEMCPKGTNKRVVRVVEISTPLCKKIGLDLDVRSKSAAKAKLDLKLLTRAVVYEIYQYAAKRVGGYMPSVLYEIFDYNFDLSSQNHRRWEFSLAIANNIKTMVRGYQKNPTRAEKVFKLPFVFGHRAPGKSSSKTNQGAAGKVFKLPFGFCHQASVKSASKKKKKKLSLEKPDSECDKVDKGTQSSADLASLIYADPMKTEAEEAPLDGSFNREIKEEIYDPYYTSDGTEFKNEDQKHLAPDATPELNGYDIKTMFQETERKLTTDVRGESGWQHGDASQPDMKVEIKQEEDP